MRANAGKKQLLIAIAVLAIVGALLAGWLVLTSGDSAADDVETHTVRGVEYSTNLEIEELRGDLYVYVLVNTDVEDIVFEVDNRDDNAAIQKFFNSLDTFVPGEYELDLTDATLRIIVDGMAEERPR